MGRVWFRPGVVSVGCGSGWVRFRAGVVSAGCGSGWVRLWAGAVSVRVAASTGCGPPVVGGPPGEVAFLGGSPPPPPLPLRPAPRPSALAHRLAGAVPRVVTA
ncbi:hypothetical protein GCM10023324_48070 [Streptomyces youssoufiensis]